MESEGLECDLYTQIYDMLMLISGNLTQRARYVTLYVCYVELTSILRAVSTCVAPTSLWCY
jgi:hypothetical protein